MFVHVLSSGITSCFDFMVSDKKKLTLLGDFPSTR
jgi:hypothetical protein